MILIADSGSTKTDWRLIDGTEVRALSTLGINPYHSDEQEIESELNKLDLGGNERGHTLLCSPFQVFALPRLPPAGGKA